MPTGALVITSSRKPAEISIWIFYSQIWQEKMKPLQELANSQKKRAATPTGYEHQ